MALPDQDRADLGRFGYAQELFRGMGGFSNFAISFSIISILTGAVTLFGYGLEMGGPLEMTLGWPLATVFTLTVAASMAELCSAYPTAGATYHWAADLGGKGWGWLVAWLNILGLIAAQAGINYSCAQFILPFLNLPSTPFNLYCMFAFILLNQGILNHYGIRLVAILNDCSVTVHIAGVAAVVLALFFLAPKQPVPFLFEAVNSNGRSPYWWAFVLGLLQAQWTYTGFDASAHMAEETHDPRRRAPWGIVLSVAVSGVGRLFSVAGPDAGDPQHPGGAGRQRPAGQPDSGGDRHPAAGAGRQGGQCHGGAGLHGDVVLRPRLHHLGVPRAVFAGARWRHALRGAGTLGQPAARYAGAIHLADRDGVDGRHALDQGGAGGDFAEHGGAVPGIHHPDRAGVARAAGGIGLAAAKPFGVWAVSARR